MLACPTYAQITATTSSTPNTVCGGVDCNYTGPSILINEVFLSPVGTDGSIWSATCDPTASNGCGEWIELYNPNVCQPVDVSCYYLGNYTTDPGSSPLISHGSGFTIPPGTIVPPGGFLVIRGPNAPAVSPALLVSNGGKTIEIVPSVANTCLGPSGYRLWFPNAGGWFAFYDNNGVVQDAIRYGAPPANDLAGQPCVANLGSCPVVSSLQSYDQIPAAKKTDIYTPATIPNSWGLSIRRGVDGGNWVVNLGASPTMGTCNSTCATIPTVTCTGTATVNPSGGVAPYTFLWNDSQAQLTQTATGLCGGTYIVTVTDNVGTSVQFPVTVGDPTLPTATISGTTSVCSGSSTPIIFNGTPNATVTYTVNGGGNQTIILDAAGVATITTSALTANTTYTLVSVSLATCSQPQNGSAVVTISSPPTATISGTTTICSGSNTTITFNGTPNATVTYTINGGSNQTIVLDALGTATLNTAALNVNTTYSLVSVSLPGTPPCSQVLTGSAVVTISSLLSASISGTTSVCTGTTTTITFSGTPNATVTYTVNGGANQSIILNGSGSATLNTGAISTTTTYSLVSVSLALCSQPQTGSAVVSISPPPTATISGTTTICSGSSSTITFSGTPNAIVTYTINGGGNQVITLSGAGSATLNTSTLTADTIYSLVSASLSGTPACIQAQSGSATVSVLPLPTATVSGTTTICSGSTAVITFSGTPNATVTYTINGGSNQTITLNGGGSATLNTGVLVANTTYNLVSVSLATCSQSQSDSAVVTVNALPVITNVPSNTVVCSGETAMLTATTNGTTVNWYDSATATTPIFTGTTFETPVLTTDKMYWLEASNTNCSSSRIQVTVTVLEIPVINVTTLNSVCSGGTAMITATTNGTTVNWYDSATATTPVFTGITFETPALTVDTTYWLEASLNANCTSSRIQVTVTVLEIPVINVTTPNAVCSGETAMITATTNGTTVNWYDSATATTPIFAGITFETPALTADTTYWLEASNANCTSSRIQVTVEVVAEMVFNYTTPQPYNLCDDVSNDGVELFDLTSLNATILLGYDVNSHTVTYYLNEQNALSQVGGISNPSAYESGTATLFAVAINTTVNCQAIIPIPVQLIVNPLPVVVLETDRTILCGNMTDVPVIGTDLGSNYTYLWNTGATTPLITVTQAGSYQVTITSVNNNCEFTSNIIQFTELVLNNVSIEVKSKSFSSNNTLTVVVHNGEGQEFLYQLDNGVFQAHNIFNHVSAGLHTVTVMEVNGCGVWTVDVRIIDYMKFFTPNNDGYNDYWNIIGLGSEHLATIYIFDRYGKLLKQIDPLGSGWDGTYNGHMLPSTDYWFTVDYLENSTMKQFKAHFSLKR